MSGHCTMQLPANRLNRKVRAPRRWEDTGCQNRYCEEVARVYVRRAHLVSAVPPSDHRPLLEGGDDSRAVAAIGLGRGNNPDRLQGQTQENACSCASSNWTESSHGRKD